MAIRLKQIRKRLEGAKRILVLGVGSELLSDDYIGVSIAQKLKSLYRKRKPSVKLKALCAGTVPENFTGPIKKFKPSHLAIIDAADLGGKAGSLAVIDPQRAAGATFSTHRLPAKIFADYIGQSLSCQIMIIGIQPKSLAFGQTLSREVNQAGNRLIGLFKEICFP